MREERKVRWCRVRGRQRLDFRDVRGEIGTAHAGVREGVGSGVKDAGAGGGVRREDGGWGQVGEVAGLRVSSSSVGWVEGGECD
jgi:hypothetical protein